MDKSTAILTYHNQYGGIFHLICIVKLSPIGIAESIGLSPPSYT